VGNTIRTNAICGREEWLDQVYQHAESLQSAVSWGGEGNEQILRCDWCWIDTGELPSSFYRYFWSWQGQWAPLCRGHLARPIEAFGTTTRSKPELEKGLTETDTKIIKRVQELAEKKGWKMSQVALAWINKRISSPIIGFSSVDRIDEAIEVRGKTLTEEEEKYLEELYQPKAISGHSWMVCWSIWKVFKSHCLMKIQKRVDVVVQTPN